MLLIAKQTELVPAAFLASHAVVFAVFDSATQDSGNLSYGARIGTDRFFVKTAGSPQDARPFLSHDGRTELLRNAVRIARSVSDAALPALRNVIESTEGPLLIYDWADGELIGTPSSRRSDPASAFARFLALPWQERAAALDVIFRLHVKLSESGRIACDFYDGCFIYDFGRRRMHMVDLDNYRDAPFTNHMGRMFGSTRFMAPEEHLLGARIDQRTTVLAFGRTLQQFLPSAPADLALRACETDPDHRFASVRDFYQAWGTAMATAAAVGHAG